MQRFQPIAPQVKPSSKAWQLRTEPCFHLPTGDTVGAFVQSAHAFNDQASSFLTGTSQQRVKVEDWLYDQITTLDVYCQALTMVARPLMLPVPDVSLNYTGSLLETCLHAVAQTQFCPQELSLELSSAAVISNPQQALDFVHAFRRNGFRVSIDARQNWQLEMSPMTWLMIDSLRIEARQIATCAHLDVLIDTAADAGVVIVAENAKWREADYLASLGVLYALSPKADA